MKIALVLTSLLLTFSDLPCAFAAKDQLQNGQNDANKPIKLWQEEKKSVLEYDFDQHINELLKEEKRGVHLPKDDQDINKDESLSQPSVPGSFWLFSLIMLALAITKHKNSQS